MTTPEFSVLLLAWDDADPSVAVLGGAALPPTLPLVYQLAARQPVVALYPHLPPPAGATAAAPLPAAPTTPAPEAAFDTSEARPGGQLLPRPLRPESAAAVAPPSRIIGLAELRPASDLPPPTIPDFLGSQVASAAPASPSQWPTGANAPARGRAGQVPAAPYLGATPGPAFQPPAPPRPQPLPAAAEAVVWPGIQPRLAPQAGDLRFDPDPELPALDERSPEIGSAEALALSAPEDDLVPDAPLPAAAATGAPNAAGVAAAPAVAAAVAAPFLAPAATPAPVAAVQPAAAVAAAPTVLLPAPEGLSFRVIAYARQAAQLVRGRADFDVLYAPNWPAWLAALEIRSSSGRPLVLYAASLASATAPAAERGWVLGIERMALRRAALVLVPDAEVLAQLSSTHPDALAHARIVPAADEATLRQLLAKAALG